MSPTSSSDPTRQAELAANLAAVRHRIDAACAAANRPAGSVTLIAVTKFHPIADVAALVECGVADLGESRDQEASVKAADLPTLTDAAVRWHFVGRLQTNKAKSVARYADLVHSVDRAELADALAAGAERAERAPLPVLVQVSLDADPERGGSDDVLRLAERVASLAQLRLDGAMAIAPMTGDTREHFDRLATIAQRLQTAHPSATILSAGMSGDLEPAIAHGATHVRVGTALLGRRRDKIG